MNNIELKTHVSQDFHDEFYYACRRAGFENKSDCQRYIMETWLYGISSQFKHDTKGFIHEGLKEG